MDSPVPPGTKEPVIHKVAFSLMGVMAPLQNYQSGDWVRYGGMLYKPEGEDGRMVYTVGDYHQDGGSCWPGTAGVTKHYASILKGGVFYCS